MAKTTVETERTKTRTFVRSTRVAPTSLDVLTAGVYFPHGFVILRTTVTSLRLRVMRGIARTPSAVRMSLLVETTGVYQRPRFVTGSTTVKTTRLQTRV